jgi:hypothetical protein
MRKAEEQSNAASCFNRASPDTRLFVLLDWDEATPGTIRHWAYERIKRGLNRADDAQIAEAFALADEIEARLPEVRDARAAAKKVTLNPAAAWPFPGGA